MSGLPSTLHVTFNRGVWRVTLDGAFDYRSRRHAEVSADAAAAALRNQGRVVTITAPVSS